MLDVYALTFPFAFQSACDSSPCQNGGKCTPDFSRNTMKCVCPREYVGDTCGRSEARCGPVTGRGERHSVMHLPLRRRGLTLNHYELHKFIFSCKSYRMRPRFEGDLT